MSEHRDQSRALNEVETARDVTGIARVLVRRGLPLVVGLVVLACLALVFVSKVGDVKGRVHHVEPWLLVVSVLAYAALQLSLMEIWRRLLHRLKGDFGTEREREAWQVSQLGKYVPTGAMLIVTRVMLAGRAGGLRPVALASAVYEFFASFLAAVVIAAVAVGSMEQLQHSAFRWAIYAAPLPLLAALHPRIFLPLANRALARVERDPLPAGLSFTRVIGFVLAYAATFIVAGLGIWALAGAVTSVNAGNAWLVIATFSVGYVASVVGFLLPAGLGVRESGMSLALSSIMPIRVAVSIAVLSRLIQVCVELLLAGAAALIARRSAKRCAAVPVRRLGSLRRVRG